MEREMGYYSYIVPDLSNHIFLLAVVCRRRFVGSWTWHHFTLHSERIRLSTGACSCIQSKLVPHSSLSIHQHHLPTIPIATHYLNFALPDRLTHCYGLAVDCLSKLSCVEELRWQLSSNHGFILTVMWKCLQELPTWAFFCQRAAIVSIQSLC